MCDPEVQPLQLMSRFLQSVDEGLVSSWSKKSVDALKEVPTVDLSVIVHNDNETDGWPSARFL